MVEMKAPLDSRLISNQFGGLVDRLHALVPPGNPAYSARIQVAVNESSLDHASYFRDLQEVLAKAERQIERKFSADMISVTWCTEHP